MDQHRVGRPSASSDSTELNGGEPDDDPDLYPLQEKRLRDAALRLVEARLQDDRLRAPIVALHWLSAEEVAQEASVPPAVFDELWPAGAEDAELSGFERFLRYAFMTYRGPVIHESTTSSLELGQLDLEELVRVLIADKYPSDSHELEFRISMMVSALSLHQRDDYTLFYKELESLSEQLLYDFDLRMREPLTVRHLALAVGSIFEGPFFRKLYGIDEPNPYVPYRGTDNSDMKQWPVDAIAAWSIVQKMTEPRPWEEGPGSIRDSDSHLSASEESRE